MSHKSSIFTLFGNDLCISKDLTTGKRSICIEKHIESDDLLPNLQYPVHSYYKGPDGYELKFGEKVDLICKIDEAYWAIKKTADDSKPYVISDKDLKKVLLSFGYDKV